MKFSLLATTLTLIATAAAQSTSDSDSCSAPVTITVTQYISYGIHTPSAPASLAITAPAPYPTGPASIPAIIPTGTVTPPLASGGAAPSGTGAYSAPASEFTGAASSLTIGALAGVGAVAALFL